MNKTLDYKQIDNLFLIKTNKYKTISMSFLFSIPFDKKTFLSLKLLSNYLGHYSKAYPSKEKMIQAKENLYLAAFLSEIKIISNIISFQIEYNFVNPCFLNDLTTDDFLDFFKECLYNVYFNEKLLKEFKNDYKDKTKRKLDQPSEYAKKRVFEILSKDEESLSYLGNDYLNEIDDISIDDIKNIYGLLFKDFGLNIFLVGNYDEKLLEFVKGFKENRHFSILNKALDLKDYGEIIEEKNTKKSILSVVYKTPYNRKHSDFYAFVLGNVLLGALPTSLLFEEIREKLSYCYYINANYDTYSGIVRINTGIDDKNYKNVIKEINKQIKRLIDLDYDKNKLELAKKMMSDVLKSAPDDYLWYEDYLYRNFLNGIEISTDEYLKELNEVSDFDISRVFSNYSHVLTHLLKGNEDEKIS